jgi:(p)ppGpp synthase/HD superfamily hydrolase
MELEELYFVPQNTEYVCLIDTFKAMQFAMEAHKDHKRKYTEVPYFTHLAEVAGLVSTVKKDNLSIAVAWLHDCMEDCGVTHDTLVSNFGCGVAEGVKLLSDMEEGNRETRKRLSRERLSNAPKWVQDIKLCDLISNTSSIVMHDPKFAKTYLEEKRLLLKVLKNSDKGLWRLAMSMCEKENEDAL